MKATSLLAMLTLMLAAGAASQTRPTLRTLSVLQFLIDSGGTGLFEPPAAYCVSDARIDEEADADLLRRLSGRGARVVSGNRCAYDDSGTELLVLEDRTPAIMLWARPGTEAEARRSRPSIQGAEWEQEAVLVRAGFTTGGMDVEYSCWVRAGSPHEVLHCDTRIIE